MKMERKNARDAMEDFLSLVYLDVDTQEGCVIDSWTRGGTLSVVYEGGRVVNYNDIKPLRLEVIGKLDGLAEYKKSYANMDADEKARFRGAIQGLAEVALSLDSD